MSHTPEPWPEWTDDITLWFESDGMLSREDYARAQRCVNGCAGLNPTAYRECVDAVQQIAVLFDKEGNWVEGSPVLHNKDIMRLKLALAHAQEPP